MNHVQTFKGIHHPLPTPTVKPALQAIAVPESRGIAFEKSR